MHRPVYQFSSSVHGLLRFLEGVDFDEAPRLLGVGDDVERLAFIDGEAGASGWKSVLADDGLASARELVSDRGGGERPIRPAAAAAMLLSPDKRRKERVMAATMVNGVELYYETTGRGDCGERVSTWRVHRPVEPGRGATKFQLRAVGPSSLM